MPIQVTQLEQRTLRQLIKRAKTEPQLALRANIVLTLVEGRSVSETARELKVVPETVKEWKDRWLEASDQRAEFQQTAGDQATFEAHLMAVFSDAPRNGSVADVTSEQSSPDEGPPEQGWATNVIDDPLPIWR